VIIPVASVSFFFNTEVRRGLHRGTQRFFEDAEATDKDMMDVATDLVTDVTDGLMLIGNWQLAIGN
jgi:hypothetical protein